MDKAERYQKIIENEVYITHIKNIESYEKDRQFGHHDMAHFLDVARVGMLINLTEEYGIEKDILYAAALLHDVGRDVQYSDGIPHDKASAKVAKEIFDMIKESESDSSMLYSPEEQQRIIEAILNHRTAGIRNERNLSGLLYRADKQCRPCFWCEAFDECNWKADAKNTKLIW